MINKFISSAKALMDCYENDYGMELQRLGVKITDDYKEKKIDYVEYSALNDIYYILMREWRKKLHGQA